MPTPIYRSGARGQRPIAVRAGSRGRHGGHRWSVTALILRAGVALKAQRLVYVKFLFQKFATRLRGEIFSPWIKNENTIQARFICTELFCMRRRRHGPETPNSSLLCSDLSPAPSKRPLLPRNRRVSRSIIRELAGFICRCIHLATVRCQPMVITSARQIPGDGRAKPLLKSDPRPKAAFAFDPGTVDRVPAIVSWTIFDIASQPLASEDMRRAGIL